MTQHTGVLLCFLVAALVASNTANAGIVISHFGNADPVTEGWGFTGSGVTVSPVTDDLGLGINAWSIDDNSTDPGTIAQYGYIPTPDEVSAANSLGWTLSANLRVVDIPQVPSRSIFVDFINEDTRYRMDFGAQADGDPIVMLQTGVSGEDDTGIEIPLENAGSGYHLYELRYDPVAGSADLFVDGAVRHNDYTGYGDTVAGPRVEWGAGQATRTSHAHYNLVSFSVVPEPSAALLLAAVAGCLCLPGFGRRKIVTSID